jgi:ABC-type oligopeptide transport system ATPase subunit
VNPLLEIRDLSVVYPGRGRRKDKLALDGVSVSVGAGETLGLVGESGSGKSTLGGCVLGLVRPANGEILFDGRDITRLSGRDRRALSTQVQAVFQDPYSAFNPHRTIEQTVGETLTNVPSTSGTNRRTRIVSMLERVGLDKSALEKYPAQFSGGQRQRIAIARALLPEPRLVVCDESVSALDLSVQAQVLNLLLELQRERGLAYLFITHDLSVVQHMSTRIAVLEHGLLVEEGEAEEVTEHPTHPYTRRLITASPQSDPDVQQARRATRRVVSDLSHESAAGPDDPGIDVLHALETQAVVEVLAKPGEAATATLDRALTRFAEDPDDLARLVDLRAAILELAARTSAAMTPDLLLSRVDEARRGRCAALAGSGRALRFAAQCQELTTAIRRGDRETALQLVSSIDDTQTRAGHTKVGRG